MSASTPNAVTHPFEAPRSPDMATANLVPRPTGSPAVRSANLLKLKAEFFSAGLRFAVPSAGRGGGWCRSGRCEWRLCCRIAAS